MKDKFVVSCEFGTQISSMDQIFYFINCNIIIRVYLCQGLKDLWVMNSACAYIYIYMWILMVQTQACSWCSWSGVLLKQRFLPCNRTVGMLGNIILIWTQGLPLPQLCAFLKLDCWQSVRFFHICHGCW